MGQQDSWKMTPLDTMLCNNQLQILKSLVFFFPPAAQRQMIFLVKLMELRQCLMLPLARLSAFSVRNNHSEPSPEMFEQIFPYCDQEKQQIFRQMQNAFQMMKTVQQFSDSGMFDNLSEMMGSGNIGNSSGLMNAFAKASGNTSDGSSSIFSSMMNPEQQALFAEYEAMLDDL